MVIANFLMILFLLKTCFRSRVKTSTSHNDGRQSDQPTNNSVFTSNGIVKVGKPQQYQQMSLKRHVVILKMFIAITACNILAFGAVISVLLRITNDNFFIYLYYINHINNPFIYLAFNKAFREDVKNMVKCNRQ